MYVHYDYKLYQALPNLHYDYRCMYIMITNCTLHYPTYIMITDAATLWLQTVPYITFPDSSYVDPLGPQMERPRTAARRRDQDDDFGDEELGDDLLPE